MVNGIGDKMSYIKKLEVTTDDGEVDLTPYLSLDNTGLLVQIIALDSSGEIVTLTPSMAKIYSSPFTDEDVWFPYDGAAYAGAVSKLKLVKTSVDSSVSRILVSIFRDTSALTYGPGGLFTGSRFIGIQDLKTAAIKNGNLFTASRLLSSVAANSFTDSLIITGSKPLILLERTIGYSGLGVAASVYRNVTYTGTPVSADVQNPNDINPAERLFTLSTGITFTSGTLTTAIAYSKGNGSNQGQGNSQAVLGEMVIMAPNTPYMLRAQSLETVNTQDLNAYITLIEGWPDIPL